MPSLHKSALPLALCVALSACISTGGYRAADIEVPSQYGGSEERQTLQTEATWPALDVAADAWWRGFGDERLDRLVEQVLADNSNLAAAGLQLRQARLQAGLASTDLWPQASASVSASSSRATDVHDDWNRSHGASAGLSWEIDLWGKLRAQRDVAAWEAAASAEDLQNTALELVGETCQYYWQLAYLNQSIATGTENLARLEKTLQLVQVQYDAGDVSGLEVREAEQNLESQRATQSQLVQQRSEIRNALGVLLDGKPWPQADEPTNLDDSGSPALATGLPAELLGRRPDLRAAELRLRESLAQLKATARSYYPSLSLTGTIATGDTSLSDVLKNPVATLGAGLSLPFLNFRQAQLNTRIAGTQYEIAANQFRTTLYTALSEAENALSAREQLAVQLAAAQKSYDAARDVERMYGVRYEAGAVDLRTWLDAQQTLRESELSLAQVKRDQLINDVTLYQVLGGSAKTP